MKNLKGNINKFYGKMMDDTYGPYYERFRALHAVSIENAVTEEELFPEGQSTRDSDMMHKMLSSEIIKRESMDKYWLDEEMVSDPGRVLKQRLVIIAIACVLGGGLALMDKYGIINLPI